MPEGHTIHRIAAEHRERFVGHEVEVTSPQGRFVDADRVSGRVLCEAEAFGKHLFYEFDGRRFVHVHLGLFGRVVTAPVPEPTPQATTRMRLSAGGWFADLVGPTRCQLIDGDQRAMLLGRLGPDPLRADVDPSRAWTRLSRSRQPLAALLMDQSVVAGIGNVYRAEVLFRTGLDPYLPGERLTYEGWDQLWREVQRLMRAGVRVGRMITTDPADRRRSGGAIRADDAHYVYRRTGQACRRCGSVVRAADLGGRRLYWCPTCQPAR